MIAPTITMPWIAFVPDISGVCSIVGTFEITSKPRKIASISTVSSIDELPSHAGTSSRRVTHAPAVISSVPVELELALRREMLEQRHDVARVELARVVRHRRSAGSSPTIVTPSRSILARRCQLAVATGLGREVDDHRAGPHSATALAGMRRGAGGRGRAPS